MLDGRGSLVRIGEIDGADDREFARQAGESGIGLDDRDEAGAHRLDQCQPETLEFRGRDEERGVAHHCPRRGVVEAEMQRHVLFHAGIGDRLAQHLFGPVRGDAEHVEMPGRLAPCQRRHRRDQPVRALVLGEAADANQAPLRVGAGGAGELVEVDAVLDHPDLTGRQPLEHAGIVRAAAGDAAINLR
jgi:hypothetical protein